MKTIEQLHKEGLLSNRTYNVLCRNLNEVKEIKHSYGNFEIIYSMHVGDLTIKELFDKYDLESMTHCTGWRGFGEKALEELKGLL